MHRFHTMPVRAVGAAIAVCAAIGAVALLRPAIPDVSQASAPASVLAQSPIKLCRFGLYFASQCRGDKFVKGPKLLYRHRFEIVRFHFFNPDDLSLSKAAFTQGPILGDLGAPK